MYICIDVGGTKTLIASLDDNANVVEQTKIPTPQDYQEFLANVKEAIENFKNRTFVAGAAGIPSNKIDRENGIATKFGNLPWRSVTIAGDIKNITSCPIFIENDAKLAGLSEASVVKDQYTKVVYMAIGTGIGMSVIADLQIDINAGDGGGSILPVLHNGNYMAWEHFASGKAIAEKYNKIAKDIEDERSWQEISKNLADGLIYYISIFQPQVVIVGGSVGTYFNRFGHLLKTALEQYNLPLLKMPEIIGAKRPEEAVIYGCYELAKQKTKT